MYTAAERDASVPSTLPGGAADVYSIWAPNFVGAGKPPALMTVEVAVEGGKGDASKVVRAPIDMNAHTKAVARCLIEHAPAVSPGHPSLSLF